uniref:Uncharacterized protein n=1 Tax=Micrurus spixii TaxID=129469 RepID=A0A2D4LLQ5_9SAUR
MLIFLIYQLAGLNPGSPLWHSLNNFDINTQWKAKWAAECPGTGSYIDDPTQKMAGFDIPHQHWSTLNRIRTQHGVCQDSLFKWGLVSTPQCNCGCSSTNIHHMVSECPSRAVPMSDFFQHKTVLSLNGWVNWTLTFEPL